MKQHNINYWFVSSKFKDGKDHRERFLKEGIWQTDNPEKYGDIINEMRPGDKIALKTTFTRKQNFPFDNNGQFVSVMQIKARGVITEKLGDNKTVKVDWHPFEPPKEWYFYTYMRTIWKVKPGDWASDALIQFVFEDKQQDYKIFLNHPFWKERYVTEDSRTRFSWTNVYEEIANKLLDYKNNRSFLIEKLHNIAKKVDGLNYLTDQFKDGSKGPLKDICPFTFFGTFNRGITPEKRQKIVSEILKFLNLNIDLPEDFEGVPILNNQKSWFFTYEKNREPDAIDRLWKVFELAIKLSESDTSDIQESFIQAFNKAQLINGVGWNLTTGLYWIRPWYFVTLDTFSRKYISEKLGINIPTGGHQKRCNGSEYLELRDKLEKRFQEKSFPVHSFPELSQEAWKYKSPVEKEHKKQTSDEIISILAEKEPYTLKDIIKDGCFFDEIFLKNLFERLIYKKNLILQAPPGTGKTWLSKRLAFALIGYKDESLVRTLQFHSQYSYEDFIRGWRPSGDGKLKLVDGPFLEMVNEAMQNPENNYVIVIEEINRGNPSQIFGEMLTLIEADKRTPEASLELTYKKDEYELIYIPENLYIIGTMNVADRSLAIVDFALRRRFAFVTLEPSFSEKWTEWLYKNFEIPKDFLFFIKNRIENLNNMISEDPELGPHFKIGHSFFTPPKGATINDPKVWYKYVVNTEILPLLNEYWFDSPEKVKIAKNELLKDI